MDVLCPAIPNSLRTTAFQKGARYESRAIANLPADARAAIISGNPTQAQPYVVRAQLPANYRIPPHWHPTTENVTVLSGTVAFGMGEKFDAAALRDVPAGGFAVVPAEMRHFFVSKTASTIQIHGMGPFGITYVDPADDPRTRKSD